jgi:hypothetical protein
VPASDGLGLLNFGGRSYTPGYHARP